MRRVAVPLTLAPQGVQPGEGRTVSLTGPTMGVSWTVQAWAPAGVPDAAIAAVAQGACDLVVAQMSTWEPHSDLCRFNRAPPGAWVPAPEGLLTVVGAAIALAEQSGGAFDPTVGGLVDLWGFGPPGAVETPPAQAALQVAAVGWRGIGVDADGRRLRQPGGLALDLSGIAKGFGVDQVAAALEALGVRHFLVEIGGELRGSGVKGNGEPWWVEIEPHPEARGAEQPVLVALHGLSLATSGDWRRTFVADGRRYSHTIDPRTRAPIREGVASVSVLHPDCMQADALCTALTVLGAEAMDYARRHDIAALMVVRQADGLSEQLSPAFERLLA